MNIQTKICDRADELSAHERKNLIAALRELLDIAHDAAAGYQTAAAGVREPELAQLFRECAADRRQSVDALTDMLALYGVRALPHASFGGELHRGLIKIRAALADGQPSALLSECERGEQFALQHYERALTMKMPQAAASLLLDHAAMSRSARTAFERMRHPW